MSEWENLEVNSGEAYKPEYVDIPGEGYLAYDPNTLAINPTRPGSRPVNHPIKLTGKFFGTKQPLIPTCSEPGNGNMGCPKWHGCPIGQRYPHVGPGNVVMKKLGTVTFAKCTDYFETTRGGRPTSQNHYGIDGYKLDTSRTTMDVLSRDWAVTAGILKPESTTQQILSTPARVCEREVGDLLPPWWPLMKKKADAIRAAGGEVPPALQLPESAKHYPELAEPEKKNGNRRKRPAGR